MDKYKQESEGALYPRRNTEPATAEGFQEIVASFDPQANAVMIEKMINNAIAVLRDRFDERVTFCERLGVVVDSVRTCPGDNPSELVRDAFEVIRLARLVRDYRQRIEQGGVAKMRKLLGELVTRTIQLGIRHERMMARDAGLESLVEYAANRRDDLRKVGQPVTKQALEMLERGASQRKLAEACKVSPKIARRWHEEYHGKK